VRTQAVSTRPLYTVLVWVMVACVLGTVYVDADLWGHLRFGLDMLRDRSLPSVDPYSFTQDVPWINHEWLSELQMGIAYTLGGVPGLFVLRTLIFGVACALLALHLRTVPFLPSVAIVFVTMWAASPIARMLRPQLWTYAAVAIVASLLSAEKPSRRLLWLPVVFLLWVNLHGGWMVGGLLLVIWALVRVRGQRWRRYVIAVSLLSAAATLVNPYGLDMWLFLLRTVRIGRDAQEWQPLTAAPLSDWWPWAVTALTPVAFLLARHRIGGHRLWTFAALGLLSFRVVRLVPMFVLVTAIYIVPTASVALGRIGWLARDPVAPSRAAASLLAVPIVVVGWLYLPVTAPTCMPVTGDWKPEPIIARSLQLARPGGKLVTEFGWGEYAIWHFGPRLLVSMDGRRETIYSNVTLSHSDRVLEADPEGLQWLARAKPEYVWAMSARGPLRSWLLDHGYRTDVTTQNAWLAVRSDLPVVTAAAAGPRQCFPA
jgi:hypothetical protein